MKDSRQSDRALAKKIGVSQPTVTRNRRKLEKEGYIKEYTVIPDFAKIGYELMVITLLGYKSVSREELSKAIKVSKEILERSYEECILVQTGDGLGYQAAIISLHKDYHAYSMFMQRIIQGAQERYPFMETSDYKSFIIPLDSGTPFRPLTLSTLANDIMK
jgi:DNA-binding Lrp family transcriptional regulator